MHVSADGRSEVLIQKTERLKFVLGEELPEEIAFSSVKGLLC